MNARHKQGFLLLEVILATALIAIGLFAIIDALGRCLAAARTIQNYTISETLLANKSYEMRVEQPTNYLDLEGPFDDYPGFTWERKFEPAGADDVEGLWKQTITVYWYERGRLSQDSVVEYRYMPQKVR